MMIEAEGQEGRVTVDGEAVTLEFAGMLTQSIKKEASPRRIPLARIAAVEIVDARVGGQGHLRLRLVDEARDQKWRPSLDVNTLTFIQRKHRTAIDAVARHIRGLVDAQPPIPGAPLANDDSHSETEPRESAEAHDAADIRSDREEEQERPVAELGRRGEVEALDEVEPVGDPSSYPLDLAGPHPALRDYTHSLREAAMAVVEARRGRRVMHLEGLTLFETEVAVDGVVHPLTGTETAIYTTSGSYSRTQGWLAKETNDNRISQVNVAGPGWSWRKEVRGGGQSLMGSATKLGDRWMPEFAAVFQATVAAAVSMREHHAVATAAATRGLHELARTSSDLDRARAELRETLWTRQGVGPASLRIALASVLVPRKRDEVLDEVLLVLAALGEDEIVLVAGVAGPARTATSAVIVATERRLLIAQAGTTILAAPRGSASATASVTGTAVTLRAEGLPPTVTFGRFDRGFVRQLVSVLQGDAHGFVPGLSDIAPNAVAVSPPTRPTPFEPPRDLAEQLSRLAELHATGALSDGEFTKAKDRLLDP